MTSDPTERVAKAIFAHRRHHEPVHSWDDLYADEKASYIRMAAAAIDALLPDIQRIETARKAFVALTEGWAELRMDTEKDQQLHDRLVEISRGAAKLVPPWVEGER